MGEKATKTVRWLGRWGFAALVGVGAVAAAWVAWRADVPAEIPSFALQAAPVYRLEVGAAVFAAAYVASMALVLALNNRAFSEIGMSGIKARFISREQDRAIRRQDENLKALTRVADALKADIPQDDEAER